MSVTHSLSVGSAALLRSPWPLFLLPLASTVVLSFTEGKGRWEEAWEKPKFFIYEQYIFLLNCSIDSRSKIGSRCLLRGPRVTHSISAETRLTLTGIQIMCFGVFLDNHHHVNSQVLKGTCEWVLKYLYWQDQTLTATSTREYAPLESKHFMSGECRWLLGWDCSCLCHWCSWNIRKHFLLSKLVYSQSFYFRYRIWSD